MTAVTTTRRTFLLAIGGTFAAAGLAACAPNSHAGQAAHSGPNDPTAKQTISVWDYDPTGVDDWVAADKDFEKYFSDKYPKITVKRTTAPFSGFAEALLTSIAGGAKYDVIYGWSNWLPQFRKNNVVSTLDSFLSNESDISADSFYDYGKDVSLGKLYGLAWYASADFMFYNKTALAAAGLPDPAQLDGSGKWDYDALKDIASKTSTGSGSSAVYGFDMGNTRGTGDYSAMARAWGTDIWNKDLTKSTLDSSQNQALWTYIQEFYTSHWTPTPSEGYGLSETLGFGNSHIMLMISGANYFRQADQDKVPDHFDIGTVKMPKGPGGQQHVCYINSYYMGARGANTSGGWTWYKERSFSSTATKLYVATGASRFPVKKDQQPVTQYPFEDVKLFDAIRKDMYAVRVIDNEAKFDDSYGSAWDRMALQGQKPADLLPQLASDANGLVA